MSSRTDWMKEVGADGKCFEERLDDLIDSSGKTAKEISKATGISESAISDYRNGDRNRAPDSKTILTLAEYFQVSTDYLFGLTAADVPAMDLRQICEYTGLTSSTVTALHTFPYSSIESNFLRRFFDDLIVDQEIAKYVPEAIQKYVLAKKRALWEAQNISTRLENSRKKGEIQPFRGGQYAISADEAADMFYGEAISVAQGNIAGVIEEMCNEILRPYHVGPADENSIKNHRWVIWSEADNTGG